LLAFDILAFVSSETGGRGFAKCHLFPKFGLFSPVYLPILDFAPFSTVDGRIP